MKKRNNLREAVKELTSEIFKASDINKKLEILLNKWKFQLPRATAILTVLYPEEFTVYDIRVREQFNMKDFSGRKGQINEYFSAYLSKVKDFSKKQNLSIRDIDRHLWGKSFYEDLKKLISQ